jgi:hypothetical protein
LRELALHLLDIAENGVSAQAKNITIEVFENSSDDRLIMSVIDDGKGMDAEMVAKIIDPFVTSRTTRKVGLGIPLLKAAAESCNGFLKIHSATGKGTRVDVEFKNSHIDRMPLGDLASTMLTLTICSPEVHWILNYKRDDKQFIFDDAPIKLELGDIPLCEPSILSFVRKVLEEGVLSVSKF